MDWSTKIFHYKIIDSHGTTIAYVYKKLAELEKFTKESKLQIVSLERTGPNTFTAKVNPEKEWSM